MKYLRHYEFMYGTAFDFVGDIIIEAISCGLKRGDVTVSTNVNIDTSAMT